MNNILGAPTLWKLKSEPGRFQYRVEVEPGRIRSFKCSSKKQGETLARAWLAEQATKTEETAKVQQVATSESVAHFLSGWFRDQCKSAWAPTTIETNTFNFEKHVNDNTVLAAVALKEFKYKDVITFLGSLSGTDNTKSNVCRLITPAFDKAIRLELLAANPFRLLTREERPRKSKSRVVSITSEDEGKLLRYVCRPGGDPLWKAIVLFGLDAGAEPQESMGVQWSDLEPGEGFVTLQRTVVVVGGEIRVQPTMKVEKRRRRLKLAPATLLAVEALRTDSRHPSAHVFSPTGEAWHYDRLRDGWNEITDAAKLSRHYQMLSMRHTMATTMLSDREPIPAVSERLGHASILTTLAHYSHAIPKDVDHLADVSERRFARLLAH